MSLKIIFMAGLLHDIGLLVLDQFFHDEFIEIVQQTLRTNKELTDVETSVLGITHCEIGGFVAAKWRIPEYLSLAIRHHHKPLLFELETEDFRFITSAVHIADTNACNRGKQSRISLHLYASWTGAAINGAKKQRNRRYFHSG